jgi:hypothetical protein
VARRGIGLRFMAEEEMEAFDGEREWDGEERRTGCLEEATVEGLRSWEGEGCRFMEADWMVEARVIAGLWAILSEETSLGWEMWVRRC